MKIISIQIKDALSRYESMRDSVGGCGDHGCLIKKPSGMATNGGCRCLRDPLKTQRMMMAAQNLFSDISELYSNGMKTYEIRNAISNCDFGGNFASYEDSIELKAASREEAFAEAERLQEEHDWAHEAMYGQDESFHNAPCYVANIYECHGESEVLLER